MGSKSSRESSEYLKSQVDGLCSETGFSHQQVHMLFDRFRWLDQGNKGFLTAQDLLRLPELRANPVGDRIVLAMAREDEDEDKVKASTRQGLDDMDTLRITFHNFLRSFARFRPLNQKKRPGPTADESGVDQTRLNSTRGKLLFLWRLMEIQGDGRVTMPEVCSLLKALLQQDGRVGSKRHSSSNDEDLLRFSREIMKECQNPDPTKRPKTDLTEETSITFDDFCAGTGMEKLAQEMEMNFSGTTCCSIS